MEMEIQEMKFQGPPKPPRLHAQRSRTAIKEQSTKKKRLQFQSPLLMCQQHNEKDVEQQQQQQPQSSNPALPTIVHPQPSQVKPSILVQRHETRVDTPIVTLKSATRLSYPPESLNHEFNGSIEMRGDILTVKSCNNLASDIPPRTNNLQQSFESKVANVRGVDRLSQGCTSLMHACQQGDIAEVLEQIRSKVRKSNLFYKT